MRAFRFRPELERYLTMILTFGFSCRKSELAVHKLSMLLTWPSFRIQLLRHVLLLNGVLARSADEDLLLRSFSQGHADASEVNALVADVAPDEVVDAGTSAKAGSILLEMSHRCVVLRIAMK